MRRTVPSLIVIFVQLLIVGLFFGTVMNKNVKMDKHISTIHNQNLNKIANSVSLLFNEEVIEENNLDLSLVDTTPQDLPSIDHANEEDNEEKKEVKNEVVSTPLVSVDASKYIDNIDMGFKVTEGNKTYSLGDYEFDVVVAVVAGEFDKVEDDALGVMSVILNRCDDSTWRSWAGNSPYLQVIKTGQFEVYFAGYYLAYMPGGRQYGSAKYNIAKQAVMDGLNGIRNNDYLGFRAWYVSSYSDKYIVNGGNRYGYN